MNRKIPAMFVLLSLPAAVALWLSGCEGGGDSNLEGQYLRVEPSEVTLSKKDTTVGLHAAGGQSPYTWQVSDLSLGTVASNGTAATYTRAAKNGVNTVTLTDSQGWTAQAQITQQDDIAKLAVSPTSASLDNNGDQAAFTASGGVGPYVWSLGNSGRGHLDRDRGSQVLYTRDAQENNTVVVEDNEGQVAVADVTQPGVPALSISPGTATVATNGGVQVFTAVGGTAPYTWSFVQNNSGAPPLNPGTGSSTVYVSGGAGTDIIRVRDANTTEAYATITKN
jgi:hypothetical protein